MVHRDSTWTGSIKEPMDRVYRGGPWTGSIKESMNRVHRGWSMDLASMFCMHPMERCLDFHSHHDKEHNLNKRRRNTFPPCHEITDHRRGESWRNQTRHRRLIIQRLSFISKIIQKTTIQEQVDFYTVKNLSACFSHGQTLRTLRKTTLFYHTVED